MNIIIIGCGRLGAELGKGLSNRGHKVSIVDIDEDAFQNLGTEFVGKAIVGHALNRDILLRAGIETADGLVAVTTSDALNMVIGHVAKTVFNIQHVVVRNYLPAARSLFDTFNLQVVGSTLWGAQRIEELINYSELETVFSAGNGEVEIYEFIIPEDWNSRNLTDLLPREGCLPVALTRAGRAVLPDAACVLHTGDVLNVSATFEGIDEFRRRLHSLEREA